MEKERMNFDDYQMAARETAIYTNTLYPILGLAEEAGEIAGKYGKAIRDNTNIDNTDLIKEMGDVLWMLSAIAFDNNVPLSIVAQRNLDKLADRKARGVIGGSGDNR
jgi:NTP pyrophosphatase (non-canonical NTP hydrolase)